MEGLTIELTYVNEKHDIYRFRNILTLPMVQQAIFSEDTDRLAYMIAKNIAEAFTKGILSENSRN